jgi:hypothetical protein
MRVLKLLVIILLVLLGAAFLYAGVGGEIPMLEYKSLKATGVPIGVVFLIAAVLIARHWEVSTTTSHVTEKEYGPGGVLTRIKETIETTKKLDFPGDPKV